MTGEQKECLQEGLSALMHFQTTNDRVKFREWTKKWESKMEEWKVKDTSFSIPESFDKSEIGKSSEKNEKRA